MNGVNFTKQHFSSFGSLGRCVNPVVFNNKYFSQFFFQEPLHRRVSPHHFLSGLANYFRGHSKPRFTLFTCSFEVPIKIFWSIIFDSTIRNFNWQLQHIIAYRRVASKNKKLHCIFAASSNTILKSIMISKLRQRWLWPFYENVPIKNIIMIPHNKCVSFKSGPLHLGFKPFLVNLNPSTEGT